MAPHTRPYANILETIGWTPLIRLNRVTQGIRTPVYAKAEFFNPGGSVKDRIGVPPDHPENYIMKGRAIAAAHPNAIFADQHYNPVNPEVHYRTTGPELWEQTEGKITHFVCAPGTGGTVSGAGRFLKEKNPRV